MFKCIRAAVSVVAVGLLLAGCDNSPMVSSALQGKVDLQGHRGARGVRPENTLPAFEYAMAAGVSTLELDTHLTKDGQLIVHHDEVLNPKLCLDEQGKPAQPLRIRDRSMAELKKLDCGGLVNEKFPQQQPVPGARLVTLTELFDFVRQYEAAHPGAGPFRFNVEMKFEDNPGEPSLEQQKQFAQTMVSTVQQAGMIQRTTVQSFVPEALLEVKRLSANLKTSALFAPSQLQGALMMLGLDSNRPDILAKAKAVGADIISPHYLYVNARFVHDSHQQGMAVIPWTANEEDQMRRLLEMGVDGIISDYPDQLLRVHAQWTKV